MKLQIASDLHLEFPENRQWLEAMPIIPSGEILLLAGDITTARTKHIEWVGKFFRKLEKEFSFIISVPGNHEFYHGEVNFAYPSYEQRLAKNHTLLNNRAIVIDNVRFLVSTLWSNIPPQYEESIELCINDYSYIKNNSVEKTNELHRLSVAFLKAELARPFNGQTVVLTHYLPSYKCVSEKFNDSVLNSAFASNLEGMIRKSVRLPLWVHGHSHMFSDIKIKETRIVGNPLGYLTEGNSFYRDFVIEV